MPNEDLQQLTPARKFWSAFQACVEENRVGHDRSAYYVKWAQAFYRFLPGKRLEKRKGSNQVKWLIFIHFNPEKTCF